MPTWSEHGAPPDAAPGAFDLHLARDELHDGARQIRAGGSVRRRAVF